jgi:hypothetical protein
MKRIGKIFPIELAIGKVQSIVDILQPIPFCIIACHSKRDCGRKSSLPILKEMVGSEGRN